jgi:type IV secretion system protein VirB6
MATGYILGILNRVDTTCNAFVSAAYGSIGGAMSPVMQTMIICLMAFTGYKMWFNNQSITLSESVWTIIKVSLIYVIATSWPLFQGWAYDLITNGPAAVGGAIVDSVISGETTGGLDTKLDLVWDSGMKSAGLVWKSPGVIGPSLAALTILIATILSCAYALFLLCLAKVAIAVLCALGPVMIAMLIFDQTKGLFEGWLRTLLSFSFIPALTYAVLAIFITMLTNETANLALIAAHSTGPLGSKVSLTDVVPIVGLSVIMLLILSQVREWSAGITGGVALQTRSIVSQMTRSIANNTVKGAKMGGKFAAGKAAEKYKSWKNNRGTGKSATAASTPPGKGPSGQSGAARLPAPPPLQLTHVKALPKPNGPGRSPGGTKA